MAERRSLRGAFALLTWHGHPIGYTDDGGRWYVFQTANGWWTCYFWVTAHCRLEQAGRTPRAAVSKVDRALRRAHQYVQGCSDG